MRDLIETHKYRFRQLKCSNQIISRTMNAKQSANQRLCCGRCSHVFATALVVAIFAILCMAITNIVFVVVWQ